MTGDPRPTRKRQHREVPNDPSLAHNLFTEWHDVKDTCLYRGAERGSNDFGYRNEYRDAPPEDHEALVSAGAYDALAAKLAEAEQRVDDEIAARLIVQEKLAEAERERDEWREMYQKQYEQYVNEAREKARWLKAWNDQEAELTTAEETIARLTGELEEAKQERDEWKEEAEAKAIEVESDEIARLKREVAALREVVEAAKAYRADHADCSREKCTENQRVVWDLFDAVDALAALEGAKEEK